MDMDFYIYIKFVLTKTYDVQSHKSYLLIESAAESGKNNLNCVIGLDYMAYI